MSSITGTGRKFLTVACALALVAELVAASMFAGRRAPEPPQSVPPMVAVVGDSYTAGVQNTVVWPTLLAERTGWSVSNFALPDAGFVADGLGGYAFTHQVDRALAANPQVIVIVGGLADTGLADVGRVRIGAIDAINKVKLTGRRTLVIGPTWFETPVPRSVSRISDAIRDAADELGVTYVDALDPPWLTTGDMHSDLSGPSDVGQSVIADNIAAWLRTKVAQ